MAIEVLLESLICVVDAKLLKAVPLKHSIHKINIEGSKRGKKKGNRRHRKKNIRQMIQIRKYQEC